MRRVAPDGAGLVNLALMPISQSGMVVQTP